MNRRIRKRQICKRGHHCPGNKLTSNEEARSLRCGRQQECFRKIVKELYTIEGGRKIALSAGNVTEIAYVRSFL